MDLTLLRSLVAVADDGTITGAADRLHVTQSALSRRLQQLESHLGAELLVRGRHGAALNAIGLVVAGEARDLVGRYDRMRRQIGEHLDLERGTVRVGGGATITAFLLPKAIADFQAHHPKIRFQVKEAGSTGTAAEVAAGQLDLGFVTLPVRLRDLRIEREVKDDIVLVGRREHPLARRRSVRPPDLESFAYVGFEAGSAIRAHIDAALRAAGLELDVVMELRSIPTMLRMVATTGHLAFVSRQCIRNERDVRAIPVRGLAIKRRLALVTRAGMPLSPAAGAFAASLGRRMR